MSVTRLPVNMLAHGTNRCCASAMSRFAWQRIMKVTCNRSLMRQNENESEPVLLVGIALWFGV